MFGINDCLIDRITDRSYGAKIILCYSRYKQKTPMELKTK